MVKDTANGRIISHCPVSPEMEAAAEECFAAYRLLNERRKKFVATLPEGFGIKYFYGKGDLVIIESLKDMAETAKYWEENS